jgi:hypothetical protein
LRIANASWRLEKPEREKHMVEISVIIRNDQVGDLAKKAKELQISKEETIILLLISDQESKQIKS